MTRTASQQRTYEGVRRIASELGCSRMTVRRYLAEGGAGWPIAVRGGRGP